MERIEFDVSNFKKLIQIFRVANIDLDYGDGHINTTNLQDANIPKLKSKLKALGLIDD